MGTWSRSPATLTATFWGRGTLDASANFRQMEAGGTSVSRGLHPPATSILLLWPQREEVMGAGISEPGDSQTAGV